MKFYKKELLSNPLSLPSGRRVRFEALSEDSDAGVLATEDSALIAELDKAAAARRGGVVAIDEKTFTDLKKNPPAGRSRSRPLNGTTVRDLLTQKNAAAPVVVTANPPSAPMEVPKGLATVSSQRKLRSLMAGDQKGVRPNPPAPAAPAAKAPAKSPSAPSAPPVSAPPLPPNAPPEA